MKEVTGSGYKKYCITPLFLENKNRFCFAKNLEGALEYFSQELLNDPKYGGGWYNTQIARPWDSEEAAVILLYKRHINQFTISNSFVVKEFFE
jgi:hypothetical protein